MNEKNNFWNEILLLINEEQVKMYDDLEKSNKLTIDKIIIEQFMKTLMNKF